MFECGSVELNGEFGRKISKYLCELSLECLLVAVCHQLVRWSSDRQTPAADWEEAADGSSDRLMGCAGLMVVGF